MTDFGAKLSRAERELQEEPAASRPEGDERFDEPEFIVATVEVRNHGCSEDLLICGLGWYDNCSDL